MARHGNVPSVRLWEALVPARLGTSFRWLLGSSWATNISDGIAVAAGPLLIAGQTDDPFLVALAALLLWLPWLIFGLFAGVLADRVNRRVLLASANVARAVVLAALVTFVATGRVDVVVVLVAMFLLGTAETFADTTSQTMLPSLVAKPDLGTGNARIGASMIVGNQLLGPPIGAALFAAGTAWPFVTQAVLLTLGALLVTRIVLPAPDKAAPDATRRVRTEIADGVRWLWSHPPVRTLALTIVTFNVTYGAAWSVLVLYARERLGLGEIGFGLIATATAVGGLISTSLYGRLERRFALATIMKAGLVIETLVHLALAVTTVPWVAMIIFGVFGAHAFVWGTTSSTVRQRAVPTAYQGRVSSVYLMGMVGGLVIGSALGGVIARTSGVVAVYWFAFVGSALILVLIWRQLAHIAHA